MRKLNYKKLAIWGISFVLIIVSIIALVIFLVSNNNKNNKTKSTSVDISQTNIKNIVIPNVTNKNTKFKISETKKEVKSVNISATNRLNEYNLYYYLKFSKNSEIKNEDYLVFNDLLLILDENCTICFKYELNGNYSAEPFEIKISNIKIPEPETEKVSKEQLEKEKVSKTEIKKSTLPYYIKVNYGANVVTIYKQDKDGNYTVPFKAMVCSCGTYTPTSGTYKTTNKYTWRILINNVYGQYATRIVGSILFHSVPYTSNKKDTLEYWEYDKLGTTASAGCVRLTVRDAKWIYDNCPRGTMVEFYSDSNPGPLGKPSAQKISSVAECRNWDPTDNVSDNPWHLYKPNEKQEETSKSENTITNNIVVNNTSTNTNINNTITENINNSITDSSNNNTNNIITTNTTNNIVNNSNLQSNQDANSATINNTFISDNNSLSDNTNINSETNSSANTISNDTIQDSNNNATTLFNNITLN